MAQDNSFTGNPDLEKKKQEIADRSYRLSMISTVISIVTAIAGIALAVFVPGLGGLAAGALIGLGGPLLTTMMTQKEQEKLKIDREFLETQMQGKNWGHGHWEGYREEVADRGYAPPQTPGAMNGPPPQQNAQRRGNKSGGPGSS